MKMLLAKKVFTVTVTLARKVFLVAMFLAKQVFLVILLAASQVFYVFLKMLLATQVFLVRHAKSSPGDHVSAKRLFLQTMHSCTANVPRDDASGKTGFSL